MTTETRLHFEKILLRYYPAISAEQVQALSVYSDLVAEWNEKINLVSRKETESIWSKQVIGSIAFLFQFSLQRNCSIVDIGTGGGLPGIPLAILFPESKFLLVDSIQKKITAVTDMIERLKLTNATAVWSRAEDLVKENRHAGKYDYVVARAVAPVQDIIRWGTPFLRTTKRAEIAESNPVVPPGTILMLKGGDLAGEIDSAKVRFTPKKVWNFPLQFLEEIPELTDKRLIVVHP